MPTGRIVCLSNTGVFQWDRPLPAATFCTLACDPGRDYLYYGTASATGDAAMHCLDTTTQQEVWSSLGDYDLRPKLAGLRVPAILLQGEADAIPLNASRTVAQLLQAEFAILPRCGHVPYIEAHQEFVRLLDGFLPGKIRGGIDDS
jgi:pimeloyl-ACP methyl ester carboxylesterase